MSLIYLSRDCWDIISTKEKASSIVLIFKRVPAVILPLFTVGIISLGLLYFNHRTETINNVVKHSLTGSN